MGPIMPLVTTHFSVKGLSERTWGKRRSLIDPNTPDSEQPDEEEAKRSRRRSSLSDPLPMCVNILKPNPGRVVNKITTAQYTPFTFLPAVLYFQVRRGAPLTPTRSCRPRVHAPP